MDGRFEVEYGPIRFDPGVSVFVVGFTDHSFIADARLDAIRRKWGMTEQFVCDVTGRPILSVLSLEDSGGRSGDERNVQREDPL